MTRMRSATFYGEPSGTGIGIGRAYLISSDEIRIPRYRLTNKNEVELERERFNSAREAVLTSFATLKETLTGLAAKDPLLILQTQIDLLNDPQIRTTPLQMIESEGINAEWALWQAWRKIQQAFDAIDDEYIKTRAADVQHLCKRVLDELRGKGGSVPGLTPDSIVVAPDIAPDDAIQLGQIPVAGIVLENPSAVSHTAILARTFGIPTVLGVEGITATLNGDETIVVDAVDGIVTVNPSDVVLRQAKRKRTAVKKREAKVLAQSSLPSVTPDGFVLHLMANIELNDEVEMARRFGAEGVGLFRTEYQFLNRDVPPTVDEMAQHYTDVVRAMEGRPVTFRTIDMGGDKLPRSISIPVGRNPSMGLRGIRYSLANRSLFHEQARAILRASRAGPVRILLPLITSDTELSQAREWIVAAAAEERVEMVPVGVMIETPASAMVADVLAREANFFSIGSNDLVQYTLAVDRTDESVAPLYAPLHLAILRLIQRVARDGHEAGIEVGVCGELAGDPMFTLLLLGMGIDMLSMAPAAIPTIRALVRQTPLSEAQSLVQGVLALKDPHEIERLLRADLQARLKRLDA